MLKKLSIIVLVFLFSAIPPTCASGLGKYDVKCTYLRDPETLRPLADQTARFWEKAYDKEYGGFYTYIGRDGSVDKKRTYKISFIQSRDAYAFARAYQLTGNKEYLDYARKGLDFMYKYAWDKVNTGWYQEMNRDGSLSKRPLEGMDWNNVKYTFSQYYNLCGMCAMYDATRNKTDDDWVSKAYSFMDKRIWDSRPEYLGYYDTANKDWSNIGGKSNVIMDAITTHAEVLYFTKPSTAYRDRFLAVADNVYDYLVGTMKGRKFGFILNFDSNWKPEKSQPQTTTSGNILKPAWDLARAYLVEPKPEYKAGAEKLIDQILNTNAYDKVNGGPYCSLDNRNGNPTDRLKDWWITEQAVTSGLTTYYITGNNNYLKMADESMSFFMDHMYDYKYGEAYQDTNADGTKPVSEGKGGYWKDAYHTMELFYYTYLYANLMLDNKPATLYYNIDPDKKAREVVLQPISLGKDKLVISGVTLNSKAYNNYEAAKLLLKIPANTGGEFKVTFKPVSSK